jgi:tRNA U34 5-carboxymethylaminomethyl modifying GTPase MnmE/TrmE
MFFNKKFDAKKFVDKIHNDEVGKEDFIKLSDAEKEQVNEEQKDRIKEKISQNKERLDQKFTVELTYLQGVAIAAILASSIEKKEEAGEKFDELILPLKSAHNAILKALGTDIGADMLDMIIE